ncbi:ras-like protein family member 11A-like [Aplysia californica]|uniref:small monomeric GTPase n=1 Tax=Aplysia californica TaxID=6500 RepID=A0ABM1A9L7_APLCA|nr:ras-like protein family member 11A-like [Aplysia californica]
MADDKGHKHVANGGCRDINIAVLGAKGVGKSAMIVRFLTGRFIGDYDSQMEAIFSTSTTVDGKHCTVHIMDTATHLSGQEFKEDPVTWADGFLLVFSLTDVKSYRAVQDLVETLRRAREDVRTPILVAANKSDLVHLRAVSLPDTEASCQDQGCLFAEVSASEDPDSVQSAFTTLCRTVRAVNKKREKLSWTLQRPAVAAKLQIRQSLRNLAEKKWRSRTSTF